MESSGAAPPASASAAAANGPGATAAAANSGASAAAAVPGAPAVAVGPGAKAAGAGPAAPAAGASSGAPAAASGPGLPAAAVVVAGAPAGSVFVKCAGDLSARFAPVEIYAGDNVARLADRACAKFRWLVGADKVKLFLVSTDAAEAVEGGDESAGIAAEKLFSGASLVRAGVSNGAFLLARLSSPSAAAPGECARAARRLLSCLSGELVAGGALGARERFRWGYRGVANPFPSTLPFHPSQSAAGAAATQLQHLLAVPLRRQAAPR